MRDIVILIIWLLCVALLVEALLVFQIKNPKNLDVEDNKKNNR